MTSLLAWPLRAREKEIPAAGLASPGPIIVGRHIPALDGIRGLAVLMVLIFHILQVEAVPTHPVLRLGYKASLLGQTGVDLFFVLSGFLITGILYDARGSRRYFFNFYGRRTLRIFPLYYGFSIFMLAVVPWLVEYPATGLSWLSLATFSTNFALASGSEGGMIGHYWTLAIEEQFYLVWPFFVFTLGRTALMRLCVASMVASAVLRLVVGWHGISAFMLTPCRIDTLLVGALLALAARGPMGLVEWSRRAFVVALAVVAAGLPLCLTMRGSGSAWLQVVKYPIIAWLYGALLVIGIVAPVGSWTGRLLTFRPLSSLGKYSYGIYLFHPPMIHLVGWMVGLSAASLGLPPGHPASGPIVRFVLIVLGSYAAAWASWHGFEKRILSLRRFFEYHRDSPAVSRVEADLYKATAGRNDRSFTSGPGARP